jgi:hypothetical protein
VYGLVEGAMVFLMSLFLRCEYARLATNGVLSSLLLASSFQLLLIHRYSSLLIVVLLSVRGLSDLPGLWRILRVACRPNVSSYSPPSYLAGWSVSPAIPAIADLALGLLW